MYAKDTTVSAERTKMEIEKLAAKYGASQFVSGWSGTQALVGFTMKSRMVKFFLPIPDKNDEKFRHTETGRWRSPGSRADSLAEKAWEQATRSRWRSLFLVIKAKLEAVESGITDFEKEFLAHIVLPDGSTVGNWVAPQLEEIYKLRAMPNLLPGAGESSVGEDR